jgi:hypothetical protein
MKPGGASTQTISSASGIESSARGEATGTARTIRDAPRARATRQATLAVAPVATPSSTTSAVRPAAEPTHSGFELGPFAAFDGGELGRRDPPHPDDIVVDDLGPLLADRPHRDLRPERQAELAHDEDVQRRPDRTGDLGGDRYSTAGQAEHDGIADGERGDHGGELPAGIAAVGEAAHPVRSIDPDRSILRR